MSICVVRACGYCDSKMSLFQVGMLASLISTAVFLMLSSFTSMPGSVTPLALMCRIYPKPFVLTFVFSLC
jgi:hypothetical protein